MLFRSFCDAALEPIADRLHRAAATGMGRERDARLPAAQSAVTKPCDDRLNIAVVGAHLSGMALHYELIALDATLAGRAKTTGDYRLFVLPGTTPPKPGLVRDPGYDGPGIEIEVWSLAPAAFGRFVEKIPAPLGIGKVSLADGGDVSCFLCAQAAISEATEITAFGGWRGYVASLGVGQPQPA